jgi:hypothetical protein
MGKCPARFLRLAGMGANPGKIWRPDGFFDFAPGRRSPGADLPEFRWTISHRMQDYWRLHFEHVRGSSRFLDRLSLFHLPAEFQEAFRILLLFGPVTYLPMRRKRQGRGLAQEARNCKKEKDKSLRLYSHEQF